MKISFDFDDTILETRLDDDEGIVEVGVNKLIIDLIKEYHSKGHEVIIVTSRIEKFENTPGRSRVKDVVRDNHLPISSIHFTNGKDKVETLLDLGVDIHYDDDEYELYLLEDTDIKGIKVG